MERWTPELRRAVMEAKPEFFAWSAQEQLRYGLDLPAQDREAIVTVLLRESGHRRPAALAKLESRRRVALPLQNQINQWLLRLAGLGEDSFVLNEHMAEGRSLLDFETLLAYDRYDHESQQAARNEHDDVYVPESYTGALHATWARVLLDGRICYLSLSMASWHLCGTIEDVADEEIQLLVPHRHVRGSQDGKIEGRVVRWDRRVDAAGQEALLTELQRRVWTEQDRRRRQLGEEFQKLRRGVTFLDDSQWPGEDPNEQNLKIVFSDPEAMAGVRFTSFLRDCRQRKRPLDELRALESRESERIRSFVKTQHEDLVKNFDPEPKVVSLAQETQNADAPRGSSGH